jgi:hypothetical protein
MADRVLHLPCDTALRLHHYATPGSVAYQALDEGLRSRDPEGDCVVTCDSACVEELLDIAATHSPRDGPIVAAAYAKSTPKKP